MKKPLSIAAVDDDYAILDAIKMVLEDESWHVKTYDRGKSFLNGLAHQIFDCIILDPHLPDLNGIEIVHSIKESGRTTPIVVLTARPYSPRTLELKGTGVHDILTKPISDIILIQSIRSAMSELRSGLV